MASVHDDHFSGIIPLEICLEIAGFPNKDNKQKKVRQAFQEAVRTYAAHELQANIRPTVLDAPILPRQAPEIGQAVQNFVEDWGVKYWPEGLQGAGEQQGHDVSSATLMADQL